MPHHRDPRRPSTNLAAEKVETTKKYKQIMWKQGGGSADHDFYIALITNNDSFKIWISEIETKKVGISLKKTRIFVLSLWFLERPESRFPFISLINDLKKKSPAAGFFFELAFFSIFPDPSLSGTFSRKSSISMRAPLRAVIHNTYANTQLYWESVEKNLAFFRLR